LDVIRNTAEMGNRVGVVGERVGSLRWARPYVCNGADAGTGVVPGDPIAIVVDQRNLVLCGGVIYREQKCGTSANTLGRDSLLSIIRNEVELRFLCRHRSGGQRNRKEGICNRFQLAR